jgi:hypothetical protein
VTDTSDTPNPRTLKHRRQAAWRERNQLKVWAHKAVQSGLRRGLIAKQPCEVCGAEDSEAHHDDHSRALDVRWLCRTHHKALHAAEKQEQAA